MPNINLTIHKHVKCWNVKDVGNLLKFANDTMHEPSNSSNSDRGTEGLHRHFNYNNCLPNKNSERLVGPLDEIVTVFVHKYNVIMPRPNLTSCLSSRDRLPRRWLLHFFCIKLRLCFSSKVINRCKYQVMNVSPGGSCVVLALGLALEPKR